MSTKKNETKSKPPTKQELKDRIAEQDRIIAGLIANAQGGSSDVVNQQERDIRADDLIKVVGLCNGKLNLSTEGMGKGKIFRFTKFGETKRILYSDLISIIENQRTFLESGRFYIENAEVVKKHGLSDLYDGILGKESMEEIISCDQKSAIELYEIANDVQKDIINRILVSKIVNKEDIDLNVVSAISRIGGKNLIEIAEEVKINKEL